MESWKYSNTLFRSCLTGSLWTENGGGVISSGCSSIQCFTIWDMLWKLAASFMCSSHWGFCGSQYSRFRPSGPYLYKMFLALQFPLFSPLVVHGGKSRQQCFHFPRSRIASLSPSLLTSNPPFVLGIKTNVGRLVWFLFQPSWPHLSQPPSRHYILPFFVPIILAPQLLRFPLQDAPMYNVHGVGTHDLLSLGSFFSVWSRSYWSPSVLPFL